MKWLEKVGTETKWGNLWTTMQGPSNLADIKGNVSEWSEFDASQLHRKQNFISLKEKNYSCHQIYLFSFTPS